MTFYTHEPNNIIRYPFPQLRQAIVCEFLPLCLERAKANDFVTVSACLEALTSLACAIEGFPLGDLLVENW